MAAKSSCSTGASERAGYQSVQRVLLEDPAERSPRTLLSHPIDVLATDRLHGRIERSSQKPRWSQRAALAFCGRLNRCRRCAMCLDAIERRDCECLQRLPHPDIHWTTAVEEQLLAFPWRCRCDRTSFGCGAARWRAAVSRAGGRSIALPLARLTPQLCDRLRERFWRLECPRAKSE